MHFVSWQCITPFYQYYIPHLTPNLIDTVLKSNMSFLSLFYNAPISNKYVDYQNKKKKIEKFSRKVRKAVVMLIIIVNYD